MPPKEPKESPPRPRASRTRSSTIVGTGPLTPHGTHPGPPAVDVSSALRVVTDGSSAAAHALATIHNAPSATRPRLAGAGGGHTKTASWPSPPVPTVTATPSAPQVPTRATLDAALDFRLPPDRAQLALYTYKPSASAAAAAVQPSPLPSSSSSSAPIIPPSLVHFSYASVPWPVQPGDYLEIRRIQRPGEGPAVSKRVGGEELHKTGGQATRGVAKGVGRDGYVFRVGEDMPNVPPSQIQVPDSVASAFRFQHRLEVEIVRLPNPSVAQIDYVELRFSQYLGRADMWRLGVSLETHTIHVGERVSLAGGAVRAEIHAIWRGNVRYSSGIVTAKTKTIYRSRSAQVYVFIQLCQETWEFDEDGERYYEKVVHGFLPELFSRWAKKSTSHLVTIILFARLHYDADEVDYMERHDLTQGLSKDYAGRWCKDFFRVAIDFERRSDWSQALPEIKRRLEKSEREILLDYHLDLMEGHEGKDVDDERRILGRWSFAYEGNVLEAVNLALNPFDEHYIDRDLSRTGMSMVVITPGTGHFAVDKNMLRLTTERMVDHGIGLDMVCLTKMPLHSVPLFSYVSKRPKARTITKEQMGGQTAPATPDLLYFDAHLSAATDVELADCYSIPKWVNASFYAKTHDKPFRKDRFVPRCKMYEIQMLGILDHNLTTVTVPLLDIDDQNRPLRPLTLDERRATREEFDAMTFGSKQEGELQAGSPPGVGLGEKSSLSVSASYQSARLLARKVEEEKKAQTRVQAQAQAQTQVQVRKVTPPQIVEDTATPQALPAKAIGKIAGDISPFPPLDLQRTVVRPTSPGPSSLTMRRDIMQGRERSNSIFSQGTSNLAPTPPRRSSPLIVAQPLPGPEQSPSIRPVSPSKASVVSGGVELPPAGENNSGASTPRVTPARKLNKQASKGSFATRLGANWLFGALGARSQPSFPTAAPETVGRSDVSSASGGAGARSPSPSVSTKSVAKPLAVPGAVEITPSTPTPQKEKRPVTQPVPIAGRAPGTASSKSRVTSEEDIARSLRNSGKLSRSPGDSWGRSANLGQASRHVTVNPCNPKENVDASLGEGRRWQHVRPKATKDSQHLVKWTSLSAPACLPLTTDYLPTAAEIKEFYAVNSYELAIMGEPCFLIRPEEAQGNLALAVMREMASQRLAQNFQFIVLPHDHNPEQDDISRPHQVSKVLMPGQSMHDTLHVGGASEALRDPNGVIYLILSHLIHRLSCDTNKQSITIQRFTRRIKYSMDPIGYKCLVWPSQQKGYRVAEATFRYPVSQMAESKLGFNYLDRLLAGEELTLNDQVRYWRTRYLLIPSGRDPLTAQGVVPKGEQFNPAEILFTGAYKVLEILQRYQWRQRDTDEPVHLRLLPTTFDPSACVLDDGLMSELERLTVNEEVLRKTGLTLEGMTLQALADMMCKEKNGLIIRERWWHFAIHEDAFTGEQFCDWLKGTFDDVETLDQAAEWGRSLFEKGLIEHVTGSHGFLNYGHLYYRLRPTYDRNSKKRRIATWFGGAPAQDPREVIERHARLSTSPANPSTGATNTPGTNINGIVGAGGAGAAPDTGSSTPLGRLGDPVPRKRKIKMSQSCVVDLDPTRKSDRAEVAVLHADIIHNCRNAFHLELNWLGVTAALLDELRAKCSAQAERHGLRFVEAPVEQIKDISLKCAYRAPLQIRLALAPPIIPDLHLRLAEQHGTGQTANFFEYAILTQRFGFVLDVEASSRYPETIEVEYGYRKNSHYEYSQFCHRTGLALVQCIGGEEGFLWADNRLFIAAPSRGRAGETYPNAPIVRMGKSDEARALREELEAFCADKEKLAKFYEEAIPPLVSDLRADGEDGETQSERQGEVTQESGTEVVEELAEKEG